MAFLELFYLLTILLLNITLPGIFILFLYRDFPDKKLLLPLVPVVSMGINGFLYWTLYLIGVYTATVVVIVYLAYLFLFFLYCFRKIHMRQLNPGLWNFRWGKYRVESVISVIGFVIVILYFLQKMLQAVTTPFVAWDAIMSWNRWAVIMGMTAYVGSENFYGSYPQLLPSLHSIIYKMNIFDTDTFSTIVHNLIFERNVFMNMGEYVNHVYSVLFTVFSCGILAGYARLKKINPLIPILFLLANRGYRQWIGIGYSDILPGVFLITFFYMIDILETHSGYFKAETKKYFYAGFLVSFFASTSAFAKQPALLVVVALFAWFIINVLNKQIKKKDLLKMMTALAIPVLLLSSFYVRQFMKYRIEALGNIKSNYMYYQKNKRVQDAFISIYEKHLKRRERDSRKISIPIKAATLFYKYYAGYLPSAVKCGNKRYVFNRNSVNPVIVLFKLLTFLSIICALFYRKDRVKAVFILSTFFIWIVIFGTDDRHLFMLYPLMAYLLARCSYYLRTGSLIYNKSLPLYCVIAAVLYELWRTNFSIGVVILLIVAAVIIFRWKREWMYESSARKTGVIIIISGMLILFVMHNSDIFRLKIWRQNNLHLVNETKEEKYKRSFPEEYGLLSEMKNSEFYSTGNKAYANLKGFVKHPLGCFNASGSAGDVFSRMADGDFLFWRNDKPGREIPELIYVGRCNKWYMFKKIKKKGQILASLYGKHCVERGLLSYWSFDEGKGNTVRDKAGGIEGKIKGAVWAEGLMGKCLKFPQEASVVDCGNPGEKYDFLGKEFSIAMWIKTKGKDDYISLISKCEAGIKGWALYLFHGQVRFESKGGNPVDFIYGADLRDGKWHHITLVVKGDEVRIYGGVSSAAKKIKWTPVKNNAKLYIGLWTIGLPTFNGLMDEVYIYNRALKPEEVNNMYPYGVIRYYEN